MTDIPWDSLMEAAADSDFAPVPAGDYDVKITSAEATKSSTDKPMWKITTEIEGGPHAGRKVWTQQTLSMDNNNAVNMFFRQMAAAGLTSDYFKTKPSPDAIAEALNGRRFRAHIEIRQWQGSPRNEIKYWRPAGGAAGTPPPPGAATAAGTPPPPPAASGSVPPPPPPPPTAATPAAAPPPAAAAPPPPAAAPAPAPPPPPAPPAPPAAAPSEPVPVGGTEDPPF